MSLPAYETQTASGIDWIGSVPAHWTVAPLKRGFSVVGGSTPKSDEAAYWDGEVIWVSPADLSRLPSLFIADSGRRITEAGLNSCGTTMVPAGSIVLSTRAPIGSLAIAETALCTNQGCKSLVPNAQANSRYFAYVLLSATKPLNLRGKGTTFLELSADELAAFKVPYPTSNEQTAIAAFLDHETAKIDGLIAEQEKLIALLAEKRQATISHAVTRGLNPQAPMKDSGVPWLGEVPAHWPVVPAKRVASIFVPQRNKPELNDIGEGICWATMEDVRQPRIRSTRWFVSQDAIADAGSRVLERGAVIASCVGNFGVATINEVDLVINQQLQAFIPGSSVIADFLGKVCKTSRQSEWRVA